MIVLIFMAIFTCMAVALTHGVDLSLQGARNQAVTNGAHAMAESGILFTRELLQWAPVPNGASTETLLQTIAGHANDVYGGTAVFGGGWAEVQDMTVLMPEVRLSVIAPEAVFTVTISYEGEDGGRPQLRVTSLGTVGNARRTVSVAMTVAKDKRVMNYAIASRGIINLGGNVTITGGNGPEEGSVLSTSMSDDTPIYIGQNSYISGNAAIVNPDGNIVHESSIGGTAETGVDEPPFPEFDTSIFEPYATNVINSRNVRNRTLDNVRVAAGSNTTFRNCTIRGVLYIEAPNKIKFFQNVTITGVIVTEATSSPNFNTHQIIFDGNTQMSGVENLPADPQFDGLRDLEGTQILAPGFEIRSLGNSSTVLDGGVIVASSFDLSGNFQGGIHGTILNLDDNPFRMQGTTDLTIYRNNGDQSPPGLVFPDAVTYVPGSYEE
ncbi:MAG: hypothetical protein QGD94_01995 [Planctomycetia bacterium]|nr:hypothetical protein [Planctomycetia bacterium]